MNTRLLLLLLLSAASGWSIVIDPRSSAVVASVTKTGEARASPARGQEALPALRVDRVVVARRETLKQGKG